LVCRRARHHGLPDLRHSALSFTAGRHDLNGLPQKVLRLFGASAS
jgi:hypothetical protein